MKIRERSKFLRLLSRQHKRDFIKFMEVKAVPDLGGVVFKDYSVEVLNEFHDAVLRALERCGEQAEGYAKDLAPVAKKNGGTLRNSISHKVDDGEPAVYIGTNVEYAA